MEENKAVEEVMPMEAPKMEKPAEEKADLAHETWMLIKPEIKIIVHKLLVEKMPELLDKALANTENKIDDKVWELAKPAIIDVIKDQIEHI